VEMRLGRSGPGFGKREFLPKNNSTDSSDTNHDNGIRLNGTSLFSAKSGVS